MTAPSNTQALGFNWRGQAWSDGHPITRVPMSDGTESNDNARPAGMSPRSFAGHLSALERQGKYHPVDGYAWGRVKMGEP